MTPRQKDLPDWTEYVQDKILRLKAVRKQAKINIRESKNKQKDFYDKTVRNLKLQKGQKVLERKETHKGKLTPKFEGPHRIKWISDNGTWAMIARYLDTDNLGMVSCERLIPVTEEMLAEDDDGDEDAVQVTLVLWPNTGPDETTLILKSTPDN